MCVPVHMWAHTCMAWWCWGLGRMTGKASREGSGCIKTQGDEWQAVLAHREEHLSGEGHQEDVTARLNLQADPGTWRRSPAFLSLEHALRCLLSQAQAAQGCRLETEPRGTLSISFYTTLLGRVGEPLALQPPEQSLSKLPCFRKAGCQSGGLPAFPSLPALRAWRQFPRVHRKLLRF